MSALEPVNAIADAAPGFVWRLQTEEGDATSVRAFPDPDILVNMSVWTSVEALRAFVSHPDHVAVLRQRRQFFEVAGRGLHHAVVGQRGTHPERRRGEGAAGVPAHPWVLAVGIHVPASRNLRSR